MGRPAIKITGGLQLVFGRPTLALSSALVPQTLSFFFIFEGLPRSVQSDQGSNLMSGVFQQVMHELGIKQYRSSAYHPESEESLQILKNTIRSYCFETEKDWDGGIHLLLFAVRESV